MKMREIEAESSFSRESAYGSVKPSCRPEPFVPLGPLAAKVVSAYSKLAEERLAPFELTPLQWGILEACFQGQADTVMGLMRMMPIESASISRNVDKLVGKGLIRRRRLRSDRRVVKLSLTKDGLEMMPELGRRLQDINALLLKGVSEKEKMTFIRTMQKIVANSKAGEETGSG